jgi:ribosomal protein S18 acetylase RimI-like enzyme
MTVVVRRAIADDADLLSSLNADVQALHAAALPWCFKPPAEDTFPAAAAADVLAQPENVVLIAEVESGPAGYAYAEIVYRAETPFHYGYEMVHLHHISVRPDCRRQGCGGALLAAVRAAANERGIALITLDVWTFNAEARAFFCRHGFASYSERLWNR